MIDHNVDVAEFVNGAGTYIELAGAEPVFIARHGQPIRVLLDIERYERLKARDTRKAYFAHELPDEAVEALKASDFAHIDPSLDQLMD